jgi:DMSO/TMAO reductase YedYZ heme-binding membrane subunit
MKNDPTFWILARAGGLAAYLLLTTSVLAGLAVKSRPFPRAVKPAAVTDIHRFLAVLGLAAVAVHGVGLYFDSTIEISVKALVVPGLVSYRPVWTGVGVVTAELMAVVYVSFSMRRLIGVKTWRRLHYVTFAVFAAATVHGLLSGTDTPHRWVADVYIGAIGAVAAATTWRVLASARPPARARPVRALVPAEPDASVLPQ